MSYWKMRFLYGGKTVDAHIKVVKLLDAVDYCYYTFIYGTIIKDEAGREAYSNLAEAFYDLREFLRKNELYLGTKLHNLCKSVNYVVLLATGLSDTRKNYHVRYKRDFLPVYKEARALADNERLV